MTKQPVEFLRTSRGEDVIVRGRRVPLLEAHHHDGGTTMLVFDRRLGLSVQAAQLDNVAAFIADVIENCLHPDIGRTFNRVHEITGAE